MIDIPSVSRDDARNTNYSRIHSCVWLKLDCSTENIQSAHKWIRVIQIERVTV